MIDFKPIDLNQKELYIELLKKSGPRGCEFSFANIFLWGNASITHLHDHVVLFSKYNGPYVYPFPLGDGNLKPVLDAIMQDAKDRGIPCRITGIPKDKQPLLEQLYPGKFQFHYNRDSYDYIYDINNLADLKGRKYHRKRNHLHRFHDNMPNAHIEPISADNLPLVRAMTEEWFTHRLLENPALNFDLEKIALEKAFSNYEQIGFEGLVLFDEKKERVLAFTMGSRLSDDTFDVHFEKALWDVDGAYPAINHAFANYIREKYPEVLFLDREEDMGLEGLRKAKESYLPHHLFEKCYATLLEDNHATH